MTAINRAPVGWLGFLGIKNFGRNPESAASVLAPTWDLQDLYLAANRTYVQGFASITGLGNFMTGTVQPGQVWHLEGYTYITNNLAAGNEIQAAFCWQNSAGITLSQPGSSTVFSSTAGSRVLVSLDRPMILQASESVGIYVTRFAGAAITATVNFCYTRLDA